MTNRTHQGSRVLGLGHFQPENIMTNHDLEKLVDTNDEWIQARTGIKERRVVGEDDTVVSMATAAAKMALDDADVHDVDLVVVASTTSQNRTPNVASRVAHTLDLGRPAVLDVNTACSGFEYALAVADQFVSSGVSQHALVIGSEALSRFTDYTDRTTCVLTADGAGACVLGRTETPEVGPVAWGSIPELGDAVVIDGEPELFSQNGRTVMRWALTEAVDEAQEALDNAGVRIDDIEVLAFHQANLRIIEPLSKGLGVTDQIVIKDVVESGNTSAASVPLGLSKAWHAGELPRGARTLLFGFGGGFTFAGQVIKLPA